MRAPPPNIESKHYDTTLPNTEAGTLLAVAAANLSARKQLSFWAKGDGQTYAVMIAARSYGYVPARRAFVAGPQWKRFAFALTEFDGMDGHDLLSISFAAGPKLGKFIFQLDEVRFH